MVLARIWEFAELDDVTVGDETHELAFGVDDRQFFNAVLTQDLLGLGEVASVFSDNQILACHQLCDGATGLFFEPQISVGHDAHQFARAVSDRNASDFVLAHDGQSVTCCGIFAQRDRILNHPAFRTLHLSDLVRLGGDAHVLVHDADAAVAGHGDGHLALSHRVHCGTDNGAFQLDVP